VIKCILSAREKVSMRGASYPKVPTRGQGILRR
jgi:hypothetical protein